MHASLALIAAVAIAAPVAAQQKQERAGISNFTRVDAVVACGGATETSALPALKEDGFVSVVNLRTPQEKGANIEANQAEAKKLGLKYFSLPFDTRSPDPALVDRFLATVSDKSNQPVYIHCGTANRVAALWMIKRVLQDGWDEDKALTEAKAIGLTSPALQKFATDYLAAHRK